MTSMTRTMSGRPRAAAAAVLMTAGLGLSACAGGLGANDYSRSEVGNISRVEAGQVTSVRQVNIEGTGSGLGTATGAVIGGAAGSTIGGGDEERLIAGVLGAVLGGLAGSAVEEGTTSQQGFEYTIDLANGKTIVVVQGADVLLGVGAPVNVIYGNRVRVVPRG